MRNLIFLLFVLLIDALWVLSDVLNGEEFSLSSILVIDFIIILFYILIVQTYRLIRYGSIEIYYFKKFLEKLEK